MVNGKKKYLTSSEEKKVRAGWVKAEAAKKLYMDKLKYRDDRAKEYPSIGDQLDSLWKILASVESSDPMFALIQAVKEKYPKPKDV